MNDWKKRALGAAVLGLFVSSAFAAEARAEDVEGTVESLNARERSFVIAGQKIYTTDKTKYEDGLRSFDDIKVGEKLEVDYHRDGERLIAHEVERDD
jgi:hypothetical protein